jgi:protein-tyrosine phosphatase
MAEFVFKDMVEKKGLSGYFHIASAATSTEEIGNSVHPGTRRILDGLSIRSAGKRAVQMTKKDYMEYDYIAAMDQTNIRNIIHIIGKDSKQSVYKLLDFTSYSRDIADPWYTGDFERTYEDIYEGCESLLKFICKKYNFPADI